MFEKLVTPFPVGRDINGAVKISLSRGELAQLTGMSLFTGPRISKCRRTTLRSGVRYAPLAQGNRQEGREEAGRNSLG